MSSSAPAAAAEAPLAAAASAAFERLLGDARGVVVALSGGPDSVALLALAAAWARGRAAPRLFSATVDHGLRSASAAEAEACASVAARLGVPHQVLMWSGPKPAAGLQEAAREARYDLLAAHARAVGATHLATAHHADDQAETVLMRLCAGSGIGGLGGMRQTFRHCGVVHVRPLLGLRKAALTAHCAAQGLPVVDDPSNADPRFARARLRALLPLLAVEGLSVERLTRLAARAARAGEALESAARDRLDKAGLAHAPGLVRLDWRQVAPAPEELRLRVLGAAFERQSPDGARPPLEKLESLLAEIDAGFAAGLRLRRTLAGRMVTLLPGGVLAVVEAPARRR